MTLFIDPRSSLINVVASFRIRRYLRRNWSVIVDMQCSGRTGWYFSHFRLPTTRWIGVTPGCSDPLPEFTGVNNRLRMMKAAELAGGINQTADMEWLMSDKEASHSDWQVNPAFGYAVLVPGCSLAKPQKRWPAEYFAAVGNDLLAWSDGLCCGHSRRSLRDRSRIRGCARYYRFMWQNKPVRVG